jgi:hypothetical protein
MYGCRLHWECERLQRARPRARPISQKAQLNFRRAAAASAEMNPQKRGASSPFLCGGVPFAIVGAAAEILFPTSFSNILVVPGRDARR